MVNDNFGMARRSKWPNEEMWQQAAEWRAGGLTASQICGRLSRPENMKRFGLAEVPSEDTVRREVNRRLRVGAPDLERSETMRQHVDMLLKAVIGQLGSIRVPDATWIPPWHRLPGSTQSVTAARVTWAQDGPPRVRAKARDDEAVELARQHLSEHPLWVDVEGWETALGQDLSSRLGLTQAVRDFCQRNLGWEVGEARQDTPCLLPGFVDLLYEEVFARALGIPRMPLTLEGLHETEGTLVFLGREIAQAPCERQNCFSVLDAGIQELPQSGVAQRAVEAYKQLEGQTKAVARHVNDLQLFPQLPGSCRLCSGQEPPGS